MPIQMLSLCFNLSILSTEQEVNCVLDFKISPFLSEKFNIEKVLGDVEGDKGNRDLHFIVGKDRYGGGVVEFWENN